MTAVNGVPIVYDNLGNPTSYLGHTLTWEKGRQLKSFDSNTYTYNANGIRTSKTVGGVKHTYLLDGTKILKETWGDCTLIPLYDNEDSVCGIMYDDAAYYFHKNLQGDVIEIKNAYGVLVARYTYDAWGRVVAITDSNSVDISDNVGHVANVNPFRYRGYYYDAEIGMYYLQSRYYDPTVGRFINGDDVEAVLIFNSIVEKNPYCYCQNSIVNYSDANGQWIHMAIGAAVSVIINLVVYLLFCKFDPNTNFTVLGLLGLIASSAVSGAFAAGTGKLIAQVLVSIGTSVATTIANLFGEYIERKRKYTPEEVLIEILAAIFAGAIAGLIGGPGPGANFKTYSKRLLKKFLTHNLSVILKGIAYYISQVGKLLLKSVVWRSIIRPFIYNLLSNNASKSAYWYAKDLIEECA